MSVDLRSGEWLDDNRANWDERVPVHLGAGSMYDQQPLRDGRSVLDPIVSAMLARRFPDGVDGLRMLHLQCHFGSDTLSLANLGANVVGIDFSRPAVDEARRMAAELGLDDDRARFVEANVYEAREALPEPGAFDAVFTTWGTIGWLPDVAEWARIIAWFLKPGGSLVFADGHPTAFVFDGDGAADGMPAFMYPYGNPEPDIVVDGSDYADPDAELVNQRTWEWMHPMDEIHGALRGAGLAIHDFREHYRVPWRIYPRTVDAGDGMYRWPDRPWLPLSYSIEAVKAGPGAS